MNYRGRSLIKNQKIDTPGSGGHGDPEKNGGPKKNDMQLDFEWKVQILYI